eukprot:TRINITY_DN7823_c0_g1_i2.p1 TRINITY_DN7823_c0_g1~~TRINITY_DN7823_c0_g1_i2.p1  ORF type:complete len:374 (+),score=92.04 TRINITY_DN7823_c0_g1_i2:29-1150(+)
MNLSANHRPCMLWLAGKCLRSAEECPFKHTKDHMPLCQEWKKGNCIGGRGNSCWFRHYYMDMDHQTQETADNQDNTKKRKENVLNEFSSPLVQKIRKETKKIRREEVDLETGRRKSYIETTEEEIIDITGTQTPVRAQPSIAVDAHKDNENPSLRRKPLGELSENIPAVAQTDKYCPHCGKYFKLGLENHLKKRKTCRKKNRTAMKVRKNLVLVASSSDDCESTNESVVVADNSAKSSLSVKPSAAAAVSAPVTADPNETIDLCSPSPGPSSERPRTPFPFRSTISAKTPLLEATTNSSNTPLSPLQVLAPLLMPPPPSAAKKQKQKFKKCRLLRKEKETMAAGPGGRTLPASALSKARLSPRCGIKNTTHQI